MEGTPNCKEQNRETNHTNQTLKATKKIVSKQILSVTSLETKVGRFGIHCTSVCESKDPSDAARVADAVSRP